MKKKVVMCVMLLCQLSFINADGGCSAKQSGFLGPYTIEHNALVRRYYLYVPHSYNSSSSAVPLLVDMHGFTSTARNQYRGSGFDTIADEEGFLVIYPQGFGRSWNSKRPEKATSAATLLNLDDVSFLRTVVEKVKEDYANVDPSRIYATGLSNGSAMAQRLGMEAPDMFAAVVGYANYLAIDTDPNSRPVPVMEVHGYDDFIIPYYPSWRLDGARANFETWATHNMCAGSVEVEPLNGPCGSAAECDKCETYTDCASGVEVKLCSMAGGHQIYSDNDNGHDITRMGWEFLRRFTLGDAGIAE